MLAEVNGAIGEPKALRIIQILAEAGAESLESWENHHKHSPRRTSRRQTMGITLHFIFSTYHLKTELLLTSLPLKGGQIKARKTSLEFSKNSLGLALLSGLFQSQKPVRLWPSAVFPYPAWRCTQDAERIRFCSTAITPADHLSSLASLFFWKPPSW